LPFGPATGIIGGTGGGAIAARTAIAAIGGGVGSKLSGGSFADGAYSAAFFHLFNSELPEIGTQRATLEYPLSQEFPSWDEAVRVTPPASSGWMGKVSSALGVIGMLPGPIGAIAGVLEVGVALINGDIASADLALLGAAATMVGVGLAVKGFKAFRASRGARVADNVIHVSPNGVAFLPGAKYKIPSNYIEHPSRPGKYGVMENGKFIEKLRIDQATPPGTKGPNYPHYHLNGKGRHYSPKPGDHDPGFNP
jgi:hypothetical protein